MKRILFFAFLLVFLATCNKHKTQSQCPVNAPLLTKELATQLINNWGKQVEFYSPSGGHYTDVYAAAAYFTGNNYLQNSVLLPTVSSMTRDNPQTIYDYFTHFLNDCPKMTNNPGTPQGGGPFLTLAGCGYGVMSGYYHFDFSCLKDSEPANARYSFQFQYLSVPRTVSIDITAGPQAGHTIQINQPAGWYIMLQNSAKLP